MEPHKQEKKESTREDLIQEGAEVVKGVMESNEAEIFELEKDAYGRFAKLAEKQIAELEEDIMEECGPEDQLQ